MLLLITEPEIVSDPPMNWTPPPGTLVSAGSDTFAWLPVITLLAMVRVSAVLKRWPNRR